MIFASPFFLTVFLPAVLLSAWGLGWLCRRRGGAAMSWAPVNLLLLLASLLFYFWGEGWGVLWLLASIAFNAVCARLAVASIEVNGTLASTPVSTAQRSASAAQSLYVPSPSSEPLPAGLPE